MIDLLDVTIIHPHEQFGNERGKRYENSDAAPVFSRFSKKVMLQPRGAFIDVMSLHAGTAIQIRGCPLKPLQGHNSFGSNDVCLLGGTLICAVLDVRLQVLAPSMPQDLGHVVEEAATSDGGQSAPPRKPSEANASIALSGHDMPKSAMTAGQHCQQPAKSAGANADSLDARLPPNERRNRVA